MKNKDQNNQDLMSFITKPEKKVLNNIADNDSGKKNKGIPNKDENKKNSNLGYKKSKTTSKDQITEEKGSNYVKLAPKNLPPSYLIDVKYDGKKEKAYVKLYNPENDTVYRWYDTNNHLPYLLTTMNKTEVEEPHFLKIDFPEAPFKHIPIDRENYEGVLFDKRPEG